jgi:hypothetical protein
LYGTYSAASIDLVEKPLIARERWRSVAVSLIEIDDESHTSNSGMTSGFGVVVAEAGAFKVNASRYIFSGVPFQLPIQNIPGNLALTTSLSFSLIVNPYKALLMRRIFVHCSADKSSALLEI